MAFHDRTLDRVTDAAGPIGSQTYREVTALRVAGSEPIPLIEDLLGAWPEVRFNIDLKDEPGIALLAGVLRRTGAWDRVCVTSFSGSRLRAARELLDRPVCMATSPAVIAAVRYSLGVCQPGLRGLRVRAGPPSRACSPAAGSWQVLLCPGAGPGGHRLVRPARARPRPRRARVDHQRPGRR